MVSQENLETFFKFFDYSIAINDGNEFENHYNEIYPSEIVLKKENTSHTYTLILSSNLLCFTIY